MVQSDRKDWFYKNETRLCGKQKKAGREDGVTEEESEWSKSISVTGCSDKLYSTSMSKITLGDVRAVFPQKEIPFCSIAPHSGWNSLMPTSDASFRNCKKNHGLGCDSSLGIWKTVFSSHLLLHSMKCKIYFFFFFRFLICLLFIKINSKSCKGTTSVFLVFLLIKLGRLDQCRNIFALSYNTLQSPTQSCTWCDYRKEADLRY